ncbi:hypothetical protein Vadar_003255 [Vaccinium darrowii]|uniref:Uncharacterized protein n=1 Tax=Vaccinium darrowii TaxID=229202 RepID=A0ACB7YBC9_9ERIC|nr:hypothetical protein Vadar_003255 [Vaccinium darrowii]
MHRQIHNWKRSNSRVALPQGNFAERIPENSASLQSRERGEGETEEGELELKEGGRIESLKARPSEEMSEHEILRERVVVTEDESYQNPVEISSSHPVLNVSPPLIPPSKTITSPEEFLQTHPLYYNSCIDSSITIPHVSDPSSPLPNLIALNSDTFSPDLSNLIGGDSTSNTATGLHQHLLPTPRSVLDYYSQRDSTIVVDTIIVQNDTLFSSSLTSEESIISNGNKNLKEPRGKEKGIEEEEKVIICINEVVPMPVPVPVVMEEIGNFINHSPQTPTTSTPTPTPSLSAPAAVTCPCAAAAPATNSGNLPLPSPLSNPYSPKLFNIPSKSTVLVNTTASKLPSPILLPTPPSPPPLPRTPSRPTAPHTHPPSLQPTLSIRIPRGNSVPPSAPPAPPRAAIPPGADILGTKTPNSLTILTNWIDKGVNGGLTAVSRAWEKAEIPVLEVNGMAEKDSSADLLLGLGFGLWSGFDYDGGAPAWVPVLEAEEVGETGGVVSRRRESE